MLTTRVFELVIFLSVNLGLTLIVGAMLLVDARRRLARIPVRLRTYKANHRGTTKFSGDR